MCMGPFRVRVSKQAERLDFNALPPRERRQPGSGLNYDETRHLLRHILLPDAGGAPAESQGD
ncbi:MAG: hypothetical protein RMK99_14265 [Anaerolineales bacterium]|nr:hypothetical protein [Anaerolineales bacterium]